MRRKNLLVIALFAFVLHTSAQQNVSTPYSRYAFGELNNTALSHWMSLGSASIAISDSSLLNIQNPATYSSILRHRPVFDIGISTQAVRVSSNEVTEKSSAGGLKNIILGLPIGKRWGTTLGIVPYSSVGYFMTQTTEEPNIGDVNYEYSGDGGINRLFMGHGVKVIDGQRNKLSLGANVSYLFGNISRYRKAIYPAGHLHTKITHNTLISDFIFDAGLHYKGLIKYDTAKRTASWISLGFNYGIASEIYGRQELFAHTFLVNDAFAIDTIQYSDSISGYLSLPEKFSYGFAYEFYKTLDDQATARLMISGQYETQDWQNYSEVFGNDTVKDELKNSHSFALGIQYIPYHKPNAGPGINPWKKINYRIGARLSNSYLQLNNTELRQYGISFGLGIPLFDKSVSMINLGIEAGKRGTTDSNLLLEKYILFNAGISISPAGIDGWFFKRKYD